MVSNHKIIGIIAARKLWSRFIIKKDKDIPKTNMAGPNMTSQPLSNVNNTITTPATMDVEDTNFSFMVDCT